MNQNKCKNKLIALLCGKRAECELENKHSGSHYSQKYNGVIWEYSYDPSDGDRYQWYKTGCDEPLLLSCKECGQLIKKARK